MIPSSRSGPGDRRPIGHARWVVDVARGDERHRPFGHQSSRSLRDANAVLRDVEGRRSDLGRRR